jgi:hypothetical protein
MDDRIGMTSPAQLLQLLEGASATALAVLKEVPTVQDRAHLFVALDGVGRVELHLGAYDDGAMPYSMAADLSIRSKAERVLEAKRLLKLNKVYARGCSEFVCEVLGIPFEQANALMGKSPSPVGSKPPYPALEPGDIAGWTNASGSGHVAIYIGESDSVAFIDVPGLNKQPRSKNGFYGCDLFESSRF